MVNFVISNWSFFTDRLTKWWALQLGAQPYIVNDFLAYKLVFNRGGAWGWLHSESTVIFVLVSLAVTAVLAALIFYLITLVRQKVPVYDVALLLAGGISNLLDRVCYGGVIDFIYLHYHGWFWPIFNVADVIICLALVYILLLRDWIHG